MPGAMRLHSFRRFSRGTRSHDVTGQEANLCTGMNKDALLGEAKPRNRVLSDPAVHPLWQAADETPDPVGPLYKVLLLTGQRLTEIAGARWSEINPEAATLTIPSERMTKQTPHTAPLTGAVLAIMAELPPFPGGNFDVTTMSGAVNPRGQVSPCVREPI